MKNGFVKWTVPAWGKNTLLLLACVLVGGIFSVLLGRDVSALAVERTLYPAYALLTGRLSIDIFAAGAGPALNPLLFIPYYLTFVKLNNWPYLSLFLSGVPYGVFLFFAWKLFSCAFEKQNQLLQAALTAISVTGLAALAAIGGGDGALWLAALGVWAGWLLFYGQTARAWYGAFFVAAFAAGLDFSALCIWVGICLAAMVLRRGEKASWLVFAGFSAGGFLVALSVGLWYAWRTGVLDAFGTFFWPSGWAFNTPAWTVRWELPAGFWEWALLPVWRIRYALPGFRLDPRLACGLIAAVILLGKALFDSSDRRTAAESVFFLGAYAVWLVGFRAAASSIILECIGVLLVGRCLVWLLGRRAGVLGAAVLLWVVFPTVVPSGRLGVEERNFAFFKEPVLAENLLVLLSGHVSGWVVFLPQEARYAGGVWFDPQDYDASNEFFLHRLNPLPAGYYSHRHDAAVRRAVQAHDGALYAVIPKEDGTDAPAVWHRYGVEVAEPAQECQPLFPAYVIEAKEWLLCRLKKLPAEQ